MRAVMPSAHLEGRVLRGTHGAPAPEGAPDRPSYWMAFRAGPHLSNRGEFGAASRHRGGAETGSLGVAKRINRIGHDLSAPFERRAAR